MAKRDYYRILGVAHNATTSEIKARYRQLVKRHHPDRQGDTETMALINEAYSTLSDPLLRHKYNSAATNNAARAHQKRHAATPKPSTYNAYGDKANAARPQTARNYKNHLTYMQFLKYGFGFVLAILIIFIAGKKLMPNKAKLSNSQANNTQRSTTSNTDLSQLTAQQRAKVLQQQAVADNSAAQQIKNSQPASKPSQPTASPSQPTPTKAKPKGDKNFYSEFYQFRR